MQGVIISTALQLLRLPYGLIRRIPAIYPLQFAPNPLLEKLRWRMSEWRAWRIATRAMKDTPAYQMHVKESHLRRISFKGFRPQLGELPEMDKKNYINVHSMDARSRGGKLPAKGVVIDESSGSTGTPTQWTRGKRERAETARDLNAMMRHVYGSTKDKPMLVVNAFALGPWATGVNVALGLANSSILKNTGPDVAKIETALNVFGDRYRILLLGYPPFLKQLVDEAKVDWSKYEVHAVCGGEGISEGMRGYLSESFASIYSSYGASDLEINVGVENDFTIALRQQLTGNDALRAALTREDQSGMPMVFQYNPLDFYIETNNDGEILVTLLREGNIAPKVRYNIHDIGEVVRFPELKRIAAEAGVVLPPSATDLPLLMVYGRSDATVAWYGSKIAPGHVEQAMYLVPGLAPSVSSFALLTSEDAQATKHLTVALELRDGAIAPSAETAATFLDTLETVNQDFREARRMAGDKAPPAVEFHAKGTGPFALNDIRIKQRYIQEAEAPALG